jgi:C-terminal processing protease CtpA/Prc
VEAPKRGRGRPAGATNKAGTGKGWSAEAKASMKAKLAARKAAKLAAKNESEFIEEDWAYIVEDQSLDAIVEFTMEEEYQSLDELSKKTLGSYIKKSSNAAAGLATTAMHLKNTANTHADASREAEKRGAQLTAVKRDQLSSDYHGY